MNYLIPILVLGITATAAYFWGRRKNRWIAGSFLSRPKRCSPLRHAYVNIG